MALLAAWVLAAAPPPDGPEIRPPGAPHELETRNPGHASLRDPGTELLLVTDQPLPDRAAIFQRGVGRRLDALHVAVPTGGYPGGADAPTPAHRASTFFIDHTEEPVAALWRPLKGPPSAGALAALVDAHVTRKSGARGLDPASVVARQREGDCTEHAVLAAAVARGAGLPARFVTGIVVVEGPRRLGAFGHAWAEVYADGSWQVADAALRPDGELRRAYVPLTVLRNEGPGYRGALLLDDVLTGVRAVELRAPGAH